MANHSELESQQVAFQAHNQFSGGFSGFRGGFRGMRGGNNGSRGFQGGRGTFRGRRGGGNISERGVCYYCNFPGHTIARCRKRLRDEQLSGKADNNASGSHDFSYTSSVSFSVRRYLYIYTHTYSIRN